MAEPLYPSQVAMGTGGDPFGMSSFQPYQEHDPSTNTTNNYQNLACLPDGRHLSFEEWHLLDYHHKQAMIALSPPFTSVPAQHLTPAATVLQNTSSRSPKSNAVKLGSELIGIKLSGCDTVKLMIHKSLLVTQSQKIRLKNEGAHPLTTIVVDDHNVEPFELYAEWLYSSSVFSAPSSHEDDDEYRQLVSAYRFAIRMVDFDFRNAIIDAFIEKLQNGQTPMDLRLSKDVYDHTLPGSPLRRLLVDIYVWEGDSSWVADPSLKEYLHPQFLIDLVSKQYSVAGGFPQVAPYVAPGCLYHNHGRGYESRFCRCEPSPGPSITAAPTALAPSTPANTTLAPGNATATAITTPTPIPTDERMTTPSASTPGSRDVVTSSTTTTAMGLLAPGARGGSVPSARGGSARGGRGRGDSSRGGAGRGGSV